jgi:hypothetical protein
LCDHPADHIGSCSINVYLVDVQNFAAINGKEIQNRPAAPCAACACTTVRASIYGCKIPRNGLIPSQFCYSARSPVMIRG